MYFWNYKQLASDLREGFVTDQNYVVYIAIFIMQLALVIAFGITSASDLHVTLLVCSFWVTYCYLINKRGDGKHFIKRLICLDLPITVQAFVFQFFLTFAYHLMAVFYLPIKLHIALLDEVVIWIGMLYIFWLYYIALRIASKQTD